MQTLPQSLLIWGAPQPSFTLLWSPPFLPPMAPTPRNWPSTPPPRPSCPHREMGPGPSQAPCLCVFLHPPILQGQASRASPVAVKALVREASPHMGSPFLTHPPSMQTTAPLPTPGLTDPRTSYTLTCPLTSPGTPCFIRLHTALTPMPVHRRTRFLFLTLCHVDPPALASLHKTPTPRSTHFPDTLSHAHPWP